MGTPHKFPSKFSFRFTSSQGRVPVEAAHLVDGETEAQNVLLVCPEEVAGQWVLEAQPEVLPPA